MTDINKGDYIRFTRMIQPATKQRVRSSTGKNFDITTEEAKLIDQGGSGLVLQVNKTQRVFGTTKYRTVKIDAGPVLGTVTVVLDDAVIVGVQQSLGLDVYQVSESARMYDVVGDGA